MNLQNFDQIKNTTTSNFKETVYTLIKNCFRSPLKYVNLKQKTNTEA